MTANVVAIGSTILDLTYRVDHTPGPGESVRATESHMIPGGKGLIQAIAARRLGATVALLGAVGADERGRTVCDLLNVEGVSTRYMAQMDSAVTRFNLAAVDATGDVSFVQLAHDGAALLQPDHVIAARTAIQSADIVLLTLEPSAAVIGAVLNCILTAPGQRPALHVNPAPAHFIHEKFSVELAAAAYLLTPNFLEALAICKHLSPDTPLPHVSGRDSAVAVAQILRRVGVRHGCITVGVGGCVYFDGAGHVAHGGFPVTQPVDAIGASDAFVAALALAFYGDLSITNALTMATAAGAYSVTILGGAPSMPTAMDISRFISDRDDDN